MTKYLVLSALLVAITAQEILDYRLTFPENESSECTEVGPMCNSCSEVVLCMKEGTNWTKTHLGDCVLPQVCENGACVEKSDPFCNGLADVPFECHAIGVFPDPFYCNKYVICTKKENGTFEVHRYECSEGFGFDIASDLCNVKLMKGACVEGRYPVPLCSKLGQVGALSQKKSDFFACEQKVIVSGDTNITVLYPVQSRCPDGQYFGTKGCASI